VPEFVHTYSKTAHIRFDILLTSAPARVGLPTILIMYPWLSHIHTASSKDLNNYIKRKREGSAKVSLDVDRYNSVVSSLTEGDRKYMIADKTDVLKGDFNWVQARLMGHWLPAMEGEKNESMIE
jgi:hypothetical protein